MDRCSYLELRVSPKLVYRDVGTVPIIETIQLTDHFRFI